MSGGTTPRSASSQVHTSALRPLPDAILGKPSRCNPPIIQGQGGVGTQMRAGPDQRVVGGEASPMRRPTCRGRGARLWATWMARSVSRISGAMEAPRRVSSLTWRHELVGGGEIAVLRVEHLVEVVEALGVVLEEEGG